MKAMSPAKAKEVAASFQADDDAQSGGAGLAMFVFFSAIILIVAGVKGREKELLAQIADDAKNFTVWFFLILVVGAVGISKTARPVSNALLGLIVIAFIIHSGQAIIAGYKQLTSGV